MFSSLASFLFGSNTNVTTNNEAIQSFTVLQEGNPLRDDQVRIDAENTIEVTSSTPSVTGTKTNVGNLQQSKQQLGEQEGQQPQGKRGKNRRNKNKKNKTQVLEEGQEQGRAPLKTVGAGQLPPTLSKLLTPIDSFDESQDEDDWFIVEKEEEESLPRTDSEEEISLVEVKSKVAIAASEQQQQQQQQQQHQHQLQQQQRRRLHINQTHSLYGGPRPQQQRNFLQRTRKNQTVRNVNSNTSTLSSPRIVDDASDGVGVDITPADGGVTQSLYVVVPNREGHNNNNDGVNENGANILMEESWFVTPPPCFTSIGPIHMETSPFENLLIEHPSMSVYHSIRSAQEAAECFVNLDLGVKESQKAKISEANGKLRKEKSGKKNQIVQQGSSHIKINRCTSSAKLKQELFGRSTLKSHDNNRERQNLCRGAIERSNKVRNIQGKGNCQRRSDLQHCRVNSGANNNRKCYF